MSHAAQSTASAAGCKPYLPVEIILYTIDCLVPSAEPTPIAIPPSHPLTKTLISLTRTSRSTYPTAIRYLYTRCLYIDDSIRLHKLVGTLLSNANIRYGSNIEPQPKLDVPHIPLAALISSVFLRLPPTNQSFGNFVVPTDVWILWNVAAPALRRLVIDIPLREVQLPNPSSSKESREAFGRLKNLELFCSVRDELALQHYESPYWNVERDPVWSTWTELRTLALYNQDVDDLRFWHCMKLLKQLKVLILTRSDGLWLLDYNAVYALFERHFGKDRELTVYIVNVQADHGPVIYLNEKDDSEKLHVKIMNVPTSYYGDEDVREICQEWVKRRILRGEEMLEE